MNQFSIPMALADFIPVVLFAASAVILQRDLYDKMSKRTVSQHLYSIGKIIVAADYQHHRLMIQLSQIADSGASDQCPA